MHIQYGVSQFQNSEVFPSHKIMFSPWEHLCSWLGKFLLFLALCSPQSCPWVTFLGLNPAKRWPDPTRDFRQKVWPDPRLDQTPIYIFIWIFYLLISSLFYIKNQSIRMYSILVFEDSYWYRYQEIISEKKKIWSADPTRQNPAKSWLDPIWGSIRPVDNSGLHVFTSVCVNFLSQSGQATVFASVNFMLPIQFVTLFELHVTIRTDERLFTGVISTMRIQFATLCELHHYLSFILCIKT